MLPPSLPNTCPPPPPVFLAIERAAAAENATTSATPTTAAQKFTIADAKNKRQINHFVRNAGANPATNDDENEPIDRIQAQSYPLQLTHAIYSQQPIYARRTTVKPEPQVVDEEQELERQQNEVKRHTFFSSLESLRKMNLIFVRYNGDQ